MNRDISSITKLTRKLNISLLLKNYMYLSYHPHIWRKGYFQQCAPNESHGSKFKVINSLPQNADF